MLKKITFFPLGLFFLITLLASCAAAQAPVFKIHDTSTGLGQEAYDGRWVSVQYTGWLYDPSLADHKGKVFDQSKPGKPLSFQLGTGRVIKGWDQGIAGMKVGGQRTLIIPPELAYGERGAGDVIPPGATLVFDVELMDAR